MWDLIVSVPDHCLSFYFHYRPHGIGIFGDLAPLLEVFGNTLENKITLTNTVSLR